MKYFLLLDNESFSGEIADWYVGQTLPTNLNEYVCFERGRIGADVKSGDFPNEREQY